MSSKPGVAFLSEGRLFLKLEGTGREVQSAFALDRQTREARDRQRNSWKQSNAWSSMDAPMQMMAMEQAMGPVGSAPVQFLAMSAYGANELYYALDLGRVGAMFHYHVQQDEERRLSHRNDFRVTDLARHPGEELVAVCVQQLDGSVSLGLTDTDGSNLREVTEGDSVDAAPSWGDAKSQRLLFQSAGIARNGHGHLAALSPYRVEQLDLDRGNLDTLLEFEDLDCLQPRMDAAGNLWTIRRPYDPHGMHYRRDWGRTAIDLLLLPFRLVYAFYAFFNVLSQFFTGKPLMRSGGPPNAKPVPDARWVMLWGRLVEVQQAKEKGQTALLAVPDNWQLVRRDGLGNDEVIATSVASFDLLPDGSVLYTDGNRIIHRTTDGNTEELAKGKLIERVVALV